LIRVLSVVARVVVGLVLLAVAFSFFGLMVSGKEQPGLKPQVLSPLLVRGIVIEPQPVSRVWEGYGTARAMRRADVPAQVSARVVERPVWLEPGVSVKAGQVLLRLDPLDFTLASDSARTSIASLQAQIDGLTAESASLTRQIELASEEVEIARRDADRASDVIGRGAGSESEIDAWTAALRRAERSKTTLEQAMQQIPSRMRDLQSRIASQEAALRQAEENVARTAIVSPIDGVVQDVQLRPGEWAGAGRVVVSVVDLSLIEVPVRLPAQASASVRPGDVADLRQQRESATAWSGVVSRVAPEADAGTRSIVAFVEVPNTGAALLRPGQFMVATVREQSQEDGLVVPRRAVRGGRVFLAQASDTPQAAVWPLASRLAQSLARKAAESSAFGEAMAVDLESRLLELAVVEVGSRGDEVARASAALAQQWMGQGGSEHMNREVARSLATALTPIVAEWILATDPTQLPISLQTELASVERLSLAHAVEIEVLYTLEERFPSLDAVETQWVVVRRRDGGSLAGETLLVSNLDQLTEGLLLEVARSDREESP
jgi:multidrug resistance efflux pump